MRTIGNIFWHFPFLGFVNAFIVYIAGCLLTLTLVAAPLGLGLMEYGKFLFWPFGQAMVSKKQILTETHPLWEAYSIIIILFYLPIGIILTVTAIFQIIGLFTSIIGIPVALVILKSLGTYLNPVNKVCVTAEVVYRK